MKGHLYPTRRLLPPPKYRAPARQLVWLRSQPTQLRVLNPFLSLAIFFFCIAFQVVAATIPGVLLRQHARPPTVAFQPVSMVRRVWIQGYLCRYCQNNVPFPAESEREVLERSTISSLTLDSCSACHTVPTWTQQHRSQVLQPEFAVHAKVDPLSINPVASSCLGGSCRCTFPQETNPVFLCFDVLQPSNEQNQDRTVSAATCFSRISSIGISRRAGAQEAGGC